MLYRCRWVGFTPDHDTWEPRQNICGNPEFQKYLQLEGDEDIRSEENHPKVVAKKQRAPKRKQPSKTSNSNGRTNTGTRESFEAGKV